MHLVYTVYTQYTQYTRACQVQFGMRSAKVGIWKSSVVPSRRRGGYQPPAIASLFEGGVSRRSPARRLTEGVVPRVGSDPQIAPLHSAVILSEPAERVEGSRPRRRVGHGIATSCPLARPGGGRGGLALAPERGKAPAKRPLSVASRHLSPARGEASTRCNSPDAGRAKSALLL